MPGKSKKDANNELMLTEIRTLSGLCQTTLGIVQNQPSKAEVQTMIDASLGKHYRDCETRLGLVEVSKQSSENTGIIKVLTRSSIFPKKGDSRAIKWAKILVPAFITLAGGSAFYRFF